ncbi:hypothetical protein N9N67_06225 [Bacteriovoracaceae bacterium]|nr:hypothetical protein [Bacteriovoracaceae bacterium]
MKTLILTVLLSLSAVAFSCPGSSAITIKSPYTTIEGDKVKGELNVTTSTGSQTTNYSINLKEHAEGKLPISFSFPANEKGDQIIFKIINESQSDNEKYIVYYVIYKGESDRIDPQQLSRSVGCGYEKEIE